MVFASSHRQILPDQGKIIIEAVRGQNSKVQTVGVFVNMPVAELNAIADFCGLDWVQLSGDESLDYCQQINRPLIKAVKIDDSQYHSSEDVLDALDLMKSGLQNRTFIFLLDSVVKDRFGGTGTIFDWELAKMAAGSFPVIIAGGLNPENVGRLIKDVSPWGVDVSSGVETGDVKDIKKIRKFIESVRSADES